MKKGSDKAAVQTKWGTSLLNKLSAISRKRRKRDASKGRRVNDKWIIEEQENSS